MNLLHGGIVDDAAIDLHDWIWQFDVVRNFDAELIGEDRDEFIQGAFNNLAISYDLNNY